MNLFLIYLLSEHVAALNWIMVFLLLDTVHMMARTTGWSRTPGENAGEWKATS